MPRNGEDARRRLQQAALELFLERGYEQTTASEIAARAGVTERTFFRHFPDKREVLFDGQLTLKAALTGAIAEAPETLQPLEILLWVFRSLEQPLEDNRSFVVPRQQVIAGTPALQERELAKTAALTEDMALALRQRGVGERISDSGGADLEWPFSSTRSCPGLPIPSCSTRGASRTLLSGSYPACYRRSKKNLKKIQKPLDSEGGPCHTIPRCRQQSLTGMGRTKRL